MSVLQDTQVTMCLKSLLHVDPATLNLKNKSGVCIESTA